VSENRWTENQNGGHRSEEMLAALAAARPLTPEVHAHLVGCRECQVEWALLSGLQAEVLGQAALEPVAPPPFLRAALLHQARETGLATGARPGPSQLPTLQAATTAPQDQATPVAPSLRPGRAAFTLSRLVPRLALGAAAVLAVLTLGSLLLAPPGLAHALPDPAVVVNVGGPLLVASNGDTGAVQQGGVPDPHRARISLITGERVSATLQVEAPRPSWFTEGVRLGEQVYLADAANDRVLVVQVAPLRLVQSFPVMGGVAGLSAGGGRVYYKSVSGQVGLLPGAGRAGRSTSLADDGAPPMPEVMDAVLLQGDTLYVTHHLRGELCLLDPQTLQVRSRIRLGGAPVGLAGLNGDLLVLDVTGRLLRLNAAGETRQVWTLPGHPDKLALNGQQAVVTDRAGGVTQLDLKTGQQRRVTLIHPMDLALTEDGHLAVAQAATGVTLLGADLKPMPGGDIR
jgi:hypothetical protein